MKTKKIALLLFAAVLAAPAQGHAAAGILDEVKVGAIAHDVAIGAHREESGVDINGELLFVSPDFLSVIWAPRPHLGISVNSDGGNSYGYFGLTWTGNFLTSFFADLGLGGAVHTGPDISSDPHHKGLGTRFLFHESVELGYRLTQQHSLALYLDHISNARLGNRNPGITNIGLRYGFAF
jgi:lipid A 3-O-deacylase